MLTKKLLLFSYVLLIAGCVEASLFTPEEINDFLVETDGGQVIQLSVPSQFGMKHGNASCGYQVAFNGRVIRKTFREVTDEERKAGLKFLKNDIDGRNAIFCENESPWRKNVLIKRGQEFSKVVLEGALVRFYKSATLIDPANKEDGKSYRNLSNGKLLQVPTMASAQDEILWETLWNETRTIALELAQVPHTCEPGELSYRISAAEIRRKFLERLQKRLDSKPDNPVPCQEFLNDPWKLEKFIDFDDIDVVVASNDDGNWIDSLELVKVLESEHEDMTTSFLCGSTIAADKPLLEDEGLTTSDDFIAFVQEFQRDGGTLEGVFYIYAKNVEELSAEYKEEDALDEAMEERTNSNAHGHWYCLVALKVDDQRQFIIADSLGNYPRIEHYRAKEIRCILQGIDYTSDGSFSDWVDDERFASSPIELLKCALQDDKYIARFGQYIFTHDEDIDTLMFSASQTVGMHLNEQFLAIETDMSAASSDLKVRIKTILEFAEEYRSGLPAREKRPQALWIQPHHIGGEGLTDDTDEHVAQLILDCAQHSARLDELKSYLIQVKDTRSLELEKIRFNKGTLAEHYKRLGGKYLQKDSVRALLEEHTLRQLMLQPHDATNFATFVSYFNAHQCDLEKIPYSLDPAEKTYVSMGDWLKTHQADASYAPIFGAISQYRASEEAKKKKKDTPEDPKKESGWLTPQKFALLATAGLGCYLVYRRTRRHTPQETRNIPPLVPTQNTVLVH